MYLGIEIGGTKLQLGVGLGRDADLVAMERRAIDADAGAAGIREQIREAAGLLLRRHDVRRIGIGFGGPVLGEQGKVITSHQIDGWTDFSLVEWCRQTFNLPAVLGNDCDVAALAESRYGAGRGRRTVFYVTVGTGIGGGLVIDGAVYGTHRPAAAEIGHLRPGLSSSSPHDSVESIASGRGIELAVQRRVAAGTDDETDPADVLELLSLCGGDAANLTARQTAAAAESGNVIALDVIHNATRTLGWAIAQAITLLAPDVVVVGGGVSLMSEALFLDPVREAIRQYEFPPLADACQIVPAALGESVVVHGAIALAAAAEDGAERPAPQR